MSTPKISVIVPIYNVERNLPRCLDSILSQTFTDFELLLINDGSPDNSGNICDEYAEKDSRIRVFHKKNEGVSSARNMGLDNAKGAWIAFVDSDDWVSDSYIQELYSQIDDLKNGIVIQGHWKVIEGKCVSHIQKEYYYLQSKFGKMFEEHRICRIGMPWSKLYNMQLIKDHNLRFNTNINYSEDLIFFLNYIYHVDWVKFSDKLNYFYVYDNPNSLVRTYNSFESEWEGYKKFKEVVEKLQKKYEITEQELKSTKKWVLHFLMRSIKTMYRKGRNRLKFKNRIQLLKNQITHGDRNFMKIYLHDCTFFDKLICYLLVHKNYFLTDFLLNLFFKLRYNKIIMVFIKNKKL